MQQSAADARSSEPDPPEDRYDVERRQRRHPAERVTSRWSGLLLLLIIPHAAFGYALVGLVPGEGWVRSTHFALAALVLALAALLFRAVLRLPWRRRRERVLIGLSGVVILLATFQAVSGLWMRWSLAGSGDLWIFHVGVGILNTVVVALVHVVAILPSILLSAQREHAQLSAQRRR